MQHSSSVGTSWQNSSFFDTPLGSKGSLQRPSQSIWPPWVHSQDSLHPLLNFSPKEYVSEPSAHECGVDSDAFNVVGFVVLRVGISMGTSSKDRSSKGFIFFFDVFESFELIVNTFVPFVSFSKTPKQLFFLFMLLSKVIKMKK